MKWLVGLMIGGALGGCGSAPPCSGDAGVCPRPCQSDSDCLLGQHCGQGVCAMTLPDAGFAQAELPIHRVDFGRAVGGAELRQTIELQNPSDTYAEVSFDDEGLAPAFRLELHNQRFPVRLGPGEKVQVELVFRAPLEAGLIHSELHLQLCASGCAATLPIRGEATAHLFDCGDGTFDLGFQTPGAAVTLPLSCTNVTDYAGLLSFGVERGREYFSSAGRDRQVAPGEAVLLPVTFQAQTEGVYEGTLVVDGSQGFGRDHQVIRLSGGASPGQLECADGLHFGSVGAGAPHLLRVRCQSTGASPAQITELTSLPFLERGLLLTAVGPSGALIPPFEVAPGDEIEIEAILTPAALGPISTEVRIALQHPGPRWVSIPLDALGISTLGCALSLPSSFDFGLIPPGSDHQAALPLDNTGATPCVLSLRSSDSYFGVDSGPTLTVAPHTRALAILRAVAPESSGGPQGAQLLIADSAGSTVIQLRAEHEPVPFALWGDQANPRRFLPQVSFGEIPQGCGAPNQRRLELVDQLGRSGIVTATISGDPDFSISQGSLSWGPYAAQGLGIAFAPRASGERVARLKLTLPAGLPLYVELSGHGAAVTTTSLSVAPRPVAETTDVLILAEGSPEAAPERALLNAALPQLVAALARGNSATRIAFAEIGQNGTYYQTNTDAPNATRLLQSDLSNTLGSTSAAAFPVMELVLAPVAGFVRADAQLAVLILARQDESSSDSLGAVLDRLRRRPLGLPWATRLFVLSGGAAGCAAAPATPRLALAAEQSGGAWVSSCTSSAATALAALGPRMLETSAALFQLPSQPAPGSVRVSSGGQLIPAEDYRVELSTARLAFNAGRTPASSETLEVEWVPRCAPIAPACGDGQTSGFEQCDDQNSQEDDACLGSCFRATCGDGVRQTAIEDCDDGDLLEANGCTTSCRSN